MWFGRTWVMSNKAETWVKWPCGNSAWVTSPPQSHLGRARSHPSRQRMHSPVSYATSWATPLQTSPLSCGYATSTLQCRIHPIRYITLSDPTKEFVPSLTGDINPQKFPFTQWKNENNSAYVQTNFKFHLRPASRYCVFLSFVPTSKKSLCWTLNINVQADYFCQKLRIVH